MKRIKKEDEGKKLPAKIVKADEGTDVKVTVTRTNLNFLNANELGSGDIIEHSRIMKVISITHKGDGNSDVELEIIKRTWSKKY